MVSVESNSLSWSISICSKYIYKKFGEHSGKTVDRKSTWTEWLSNVMSFKELYKKIVDMKKASLFEVHQVWSDFFLNGWLL